jgi:hypothetical protein
MLAVVKRFALVLALAGCMPDGALVAPTGHHRLTARDAKSGVTVILTTAAWQGEPADLEAELTVMHVLVANLGKEPVLLAPGDIELVDERGFRYDLLDPGATFYLASEETPPGGSYARAYREDYDIGRAQEFQWFEAHGDIAKQALPWGVLEPGTQMRGYLYFEPMVEHANGGKLIWRFGTPDHRPLVDTVFELAVAR